MPYKNKNKVRHKFDKVQYKVRNWKEYEKSLISRGSLTVWFSEEAIENWSPKVEKKKRGGQQIYTDLAIETGLTLRKIYNLTLRGTEGFIGSISELLSLDIEVPTTLHYQSDLNI